MNPIYSLGVQSDMPYPRVMVASSLPSYAETKLQSALSTVPEPLNASDVMIDAKSISSGFTGLVEDTSPGSSVKLFQPMPSVQDEDGGTRGTFLNEEELERDNDLSPTMSKMDSGFEQSSAPKARLKNIHRQLSSLDVCKTYMYKSTGVSKRTIGVKSQVRLMLAYLEGIVDGIDE